MHGYRGLVKSILCMPMTANIFDYFEETPTHDGERPPWAARAPRRPHKRFDLRLVPRLPEWEQDADSLHALERIEREPWVQAVMRNREGVTVRLKESWIEARGAALEAGGSAEAALGDLAGGQRFSVQFWDANATKALHVGHLRNLAIGNALSAALTQAGGQVERRSLDLRRGAQHGRGDGRRDEQRTARARMARRR